MQLTTGVLPPSALNMRIEVIELQIKKAYTMDVPGIERKIYGVESAAPIFCESIGSSNVEKVAMLSTDCTNRAINYFTISMGDISSVRVSLAQLFRAALLSNASKIIVAHNHPSGVLAITSEDIEMTKKIAFLAKCFDIELIDSLVVSGNEAVSIREHCGELKDER